jgi:acyl carrier protein
MTKQFADILNCIKPEILENPNANLVEDRIIDSLDVMNLIAELEQAYSVDFDPDDVTPENFASVDAIWSLVRRAIADRTGDHNA